MSNRRLKYINYEQCLLSLRTRWQNQFVTRRLCVTFCANVAFQEKNYIYFDYILQYNFSTASDFGPYRANTTTGQIHVNLRQNVIRSEDLTAVII
jgi:hypothetical protein